MLSKTSEPVKLARVPGKIQLPESIPEGPATLRIGSRTIVPEPVTAFCRRTKPSARTKANVAPCATLIVAAALTRLDE